MPEGLAVLALGGSPNGDKFHDGAFHVKVLDDLEASSDNLGTGERNDDDRHRFGGTIVS